MGSLIKSIRRKRLVSEKSRHPNKPKNCRSSWTKIRNFKSSGSPPILNSTSKMGRLRPRMVIMHLPETTCISAKRFLVGQIRAPIRAFYRRNMELKMLMKSILVARSPLRFSSLCNKVRDQSAATKTPRAKATSGDSLIITRIRSNTAPEIRIPSIRSLRLRVRRFLRLMLVMQMVPDLVTWWILKHPRICLSWSHHIRLIWPGSLPKASPPDSHPTKTVKKA